MRQTTDKLSSRTDGTYCAAGVTDEKPPITPPERALIVAYHGVGLTHTEIAEQVGRPKRSVDRLIRALREAAREADDPLDVFADAVGPALATDPDAGRGGDA